VKYLVTIHTTTRSIVELDVVAPTEHTDDQVKANIKASSPDIVLSTGRVVGRSQISQEIIDVDVNV
jgi:pyrrolidone-carboxylate peptidase